MEPKSTHSAALFSFFRLHPDCVYENSLNRRLFKEEEGSVEHWFINKKRSTRTDKHGSRESFVSSPSNRRECRANVNYYARWEFSDCAFADVKLSHMRWVAPDFCFLLSYWTFKPDPCQRSAVCHVVTSTSSPPITHKPLTSWWDANF